MRDEAGKAAPGIISERIRDTLIRGRDGLYGLVYIRDRGVSKLC